MKQQKISNGSDMNMHLAVWGKYSREVRKWDFHVISEPASQPAPPAASNNG